MQGFPIFCEKDGNRLSPGRMEGEFNPWTGELLKARQLMTVKCMVCGTIYEKRAVPPKYEEQVGRVWINP